MSDKTQAAMHPFDGWMGSVGEYLYANTGKILAARREFIMATNLEPTTLFLPPLMSKAVEAVKQVTQENALIWYNMAVLVADVEEITLGFGVSQVCPA